jgi:hypothetical protein
MECDLLSLKVADQIPGSIDRDLIIDREQNPPVSLDRLFDFCTLFTHCCRPVSGGSNVATCSLYDDFGDVLFHRNRPLWSGGILCCLTGRQALGQRSIRRKAGVLSQ